MPKLYELSRLYVQKRMLHGHCRVPFGVLGPRALTAPPIHSNPLQQLRFIFHYPVDHNLYTIMRNIKQKYFEQFIIFCLKSKFVGMLFLCFYSICSDFYVIFCTGLVIIINVGLNDGGLEGSINKFNFLLKIHSVTKLYQTIGQSH